MARPRHAVLTRTRIVDAATALIDTEGLEAVSTRRLAAELGVAGPSLYNHFRTKDDILDAVANTIIAEVDLSVFAEREWREAIEIWARSYRAALAAHPNIVPFLVSSGLGRRPAALRMADEVFGSLIAAGWPRGWATRIGAVLRYIVTGSSMGSFARGFIDDAQVYVDHYPHLDEAHLLMKHQREVDDGAFELGLRILLDGLASVHADVSVHPDVFSVHADVSVHPYVSVHPDVSVPADPKAVGRRGDSEL